MPTTPPILLLTSLYPPAIGGSPILFENLYSRLTTAAVTVLTDETLSPGSDVQRGRVHIVRGRVAAPNWGILSGAAIRRTLSTAAQVRAAAADGAIVHAGKALPEGIGALAARLQGGPRYVCWCHGEEVLYAKASRELVFLTRRVYRNAAGILANSRNTARLLEGIGAPPDRISIIYPGVDPSQFRPEIDGRAVRDRFGASADEVVLLSVGRLQRRKGHDLVIEALARLGPRAQSLRYVIAGQGEERERLERLAVDGGVKDRVVFAGAVAPADLPAFYAASDVFLLPTRADGSDVEGFGIVFLEAAASGRPVIAGRNGGVPEAVAESETGLLVSGTDVEELASAISTLAGDPALRRRLGDAGRARVLRDFTWDRGAADLEQFHMRMQRHDGNDGIDRGR